MTRRAIGPRAGRGKVVPDGGRENPVKSGGVLGYQTTNMRAVWDRATERAPAPSVPLLSCGPSTFPDVATVAASDDGPGGTRHAGAAGAQGRVGDAHRGKRRRNGRCGVTEPGRGYSASGRSASSSSSLK